MVRLFESSDLPTPPQRLRRARTLLADRSAKPADPTSIDRSVSHMSPSRVGGRRWLLSALLYLLPWLLALGVDIALYAAAYPVPTPGTVALIGLLAFTVVRSQTRTTRAIRAQLAAMDLRHTERFEVVRDSQVEQGRMLDEVTGGIPEIATVSDVRRLAETVACDARDRDLQIARVHDLVDAARAEAKEELRASMNWVIQQLRAGGP